MNHVLSCGHTVQDMDSGHQITVKSTDRRGERALAYMTVCGRCMGDYAVAGDLFESDADAERWLLKWGCLQ